MAAETWARSARRAGSRPAQAPTAAAECNQRIFAADAIAVPPSQMSASPAYAPDRRSLLMPQIFGAAPNDEGHSLKWPRASPIHPRLQRRARPPRPEGLRGLDGLAVRNLLRGAVLAYCTTSKNRTIREA